MAGPGEPAHVALEICPFARNRNILRILPGVGPVAIHPQASPDAHLCCGSTLHTVTGARAAITIIIHPYPPRSLPATAAAVSSFRELWLCVKLMYISFCAT